MDRVIGIDLGTTNSVAAYYEQGQTIVIPNSEGSKTTPSVVLFRSRDEIIVGELAKRQRLTSPEQTVYSVKRFMGARFSEIGDKLRGISYKVVAGPEDSVLIDVGWTQLTPEQVAAEILKKMRSTAEEYFGETVDKAVITVPAYFNDNQRQATKRAGELAGLQVLRIINEPTAAALAFGITKNAEQRVAVFDFGGGTFDVSVLELDRDIFEVKATRGNTFLGGDNIDQILFEHFTAKFQEEMQIDLLQDIQAVQRLREACEKVKCELSSASETLLSVPFITASDGIPKHLNYRIKREALQQLIEPVMPELIDCCRETLRDAAFSTRDITAVLLVGGSTRIPLVQKSVREYFGAEPNRTLSPDEAVAIGAAIQASIMSGGLREVLLLDVTPLSLGIELAGGVFSILIPRNSSIPTVAHKTFTTVTDNQTTVRVHVLQGERKVATENQSLGFFRLMGIAPAPKEIPEIDVSFQIDANGILNVSATDAMSGVTNAVTIESFGYVSPEEAGGIVSAAEAAAEEDRTFMRLTYLRKRGAGMVAELNARLEDESRKLPEDEAHKLREMIFRWDVVSKSNDRTQIETALSELEQLHVLYRDPLLPQTP